MGIIGSFLESTFPGNPHRTSFHICSLSLTASVATSVSFCVLWRHSVCPEAFFRLHTTQHLTKTKNQTHFCIFFLSFISSFVSFLSFVSFSSFVPMKERKQRRRDFPIGRQSWSSWPKLNSLPTPLFPFLYSFTFTSSSFFITSSTSSSFSSSSSSSVTFSP